MYCIVFPLALAVEKITIFTHSVRQILYVERLMEPIGFLNFLSDVRYFDIHIIHKTYFSQDVNPAPKFI